MKKRGLAAVLAAAALFLGAGATDARAAGTQAAAVEYAGADISVWQGEVDFAALAQSGVEVVYLRGAESVYTDANFEANFRGATDAGLQVGVYHYMNAATADEAVAQARYFAGLLAGRGYACRPVMDYERFGGRDAAAVNAIALAYLHELEARLGQRPMVYSNAYNAQTLWDASLASYPLWVADYASPAPATGPWAAWAGFQYTDAGALPGISTAVDLDRFTPAVFLTEAEQPPQCPLARHTVAVGDTLWALACRYGTTVEAIAAQNRLADPNFILIGWVLEIPVGACR